MKTHILNFFIENEECPIDLQDFKNKYFLELKQIKDTCDKCEIQNIRKKYLEILLKYDI